MWVESVHQELSPSEDKVQLFPAAIAGLHTWCCEFSLPRKIAFNMYLKQSDKRSLVNYQGSLHTNIEVASLDLPHLGDEVYTFLAEEVHIEAAVH